MSYVMSIFMGFVQGIAEFLPISSSGHLALVQYFFGVEDVEQSHMFFSVLLHLGTFISVCIVYWRDIWEMIVEFFAGIAALFSRGGSRQVPPPPARRLVFMIIIATLPLVLIVPINKVIGQMSSNATFVGFALLVTGCLLFFSDRLSRGRKTAKNATFLDALIVGLGQCVAVVPGLSRSGTTISVGLMRGFNRSFAVRFSFLLSLPAILGANILEIKDAVEAGIDTALLPVYFVGVLVAMVSGYFAIRLVKLLSDKGKFGKFAYYCWAVGLVSIIASIFIK